MTCLALPSAGLSLSALLQSLGPIAATLHHRIAPRAPCATELRIDVMLPLVEGELEAIYERLYQPGSKLHGLQRRPLHDPQFQLHWREADGEWFAYLEDCANRCLAGYTVFNRLVEVDRRTDRHVRSPHSRFAPQYQRRGLASAVYRQVLDAGTCLVSGARQSPGAHGLWNHLARRYDSRYVGITPAKSLRHLGCEVEPALMDQLSTRRMLMGAGWTLQAFAQAVRMQC